LERADVVVVFFVNLGRSDFSREVILPETRQGKGKDAKKITLVANSIGTMSALQAAIDEPDLYQGVFIISPNFRELHSAEVPLSFVTMAIVRQIQRVLRNGLGQQAFDLLANPSTVKQILNEPYAMKDAVDDTLVQVLLDPLLTPGASDVIFDTLSYSAGPIPEQQLSIFPKQLPVWICYGDADPWTPGLRVESLGKRFAPVVERVERLPGVGHCPHDEAPELVHPLIEAFMKRLREKK
jgi:pimeloyl-ACP methyl ester carboxylesterase